MLKNSKFGLDFGTSNSLIYSDSKGILINEPSVVALSINDKTILSVGEEAKEMIGKTPEGIISKKPIKGGAIANYKVSESMIKYFFSKISKFNMRTQVVASISSGLTSVEKRAIYEAIMNSGIKKIYLVPEALLSAIGANLPIGTSSGNMVINIGGGTAELAVISLNGVVVSESIRVGGDSINEAIISYLRKHHGLIIGDQTAEMVKLEIGSALPLTTPLEIEIRGRDTITGMPRSLTVNTNITVEAIKAPLGNIIQATRSILEKTPPELSSDIIDRGILLTGGTALLRNIDILLTRAIGIPAYIADEPLLTTVKGASEALKYIDLLSKNIKNF
ncbi:rod shape-determining protein [Patescibacteria group bacterium]|nr:rod shape-determining protein [Patescibacteria group bacterium]